MFHLFKIFGKVRLTIKTEIKGTVSVASEAEGQLDTECSILCIYPFYPLFVDCAVSGVELVVSSMSFQIKNGAR